MVNIAPYIAKVFSSLTPQFSVSINLSLQYVRLLHATEERVDIPYSQTQFGVVLMVDVAGTRRLSCLVFEG